MKITKERLKQIIKEEVGGFQTTYDAAAADADTKIAELTPQVEEMLQNTYVGGYGAEGGTNIYDLIEEHSPGSADRVVKSLAMQIKNVITMQR